MSHNCALHTPSGLLTLLYQLPLGSNMVCTHETLEVIWPIFPPEARGIPVKWGCCVSTCQDDVRNRWWSQKFWPREWFQETRNFVRWNDSDVLLVGDSTQAIKKNVAELTWRGNATDLSLLPTMSSADIERLQSVGKEAQSASRQYILRDDIDQAWTHLSNLRGSRLDIVLDNCKQYFWASFLPVA